MLKYLLLNFFYYHKTSKTHLPSTWPLLCTFNHQAMRKSVQPTRRHDSAKIWCSTSRELSLVCARCRFPTKASQTPGRRWKERERRRASIAAGLFAEMSRSVSRGTSTSSSWTAARCDHLQTGPGVGADKPARSLLRWEPSGTFD